MMLSLTCSCLLDVDVFKIFYNFCLGVTLQTVKKITLAYFGSLMVDIQGEYMTRVLCSIVTSTVHRNTYILHKIIKNSLTLNNQVCIIASQSINQ